MEVLIGDYRISPYHGNTCWQIQKRNVNRKSESGKEWCDPYKYPTTLGHALRLVREQMLLEDGSSALSGIDSMISAVNKVDGSFRELLDGLELRPKDVG